MEFKKKIYNNKLVMVTQHTARNITYGGCCCCKVAAAAHDTARLCM